MKKSVKKILSLAVATTVLSVPVSSLAATIYVGNVGFDTNKIAGNANYESAFRNFLTQNVGKGVKIDFNDDGKAVSTNDYANSGSTNIASYDASNGVTIPGDYSVWDGTGTPGTPTQTELKVESVSAINAKTIKVKFNAPVQAGTATGGGQVLANYIYGASTNPTKVVLSADKTEATLTFGATTGLSADLNKYVQFQVKDIKTADGKSTVEAYKAALLVEDKVAPTATSKYEAPVVTVEFSEPLAYGSSVLTGATVAVDGVATTAYGIVEDNSTDTYKGAKAITLDAGAGGLNLANGKHTVSVVGAKDLAGNFLPDYNTEITVTADTVAPKLVSLTAEGNMIRVKFDERLVDVSLNSQASKRVWLSDGTNDIYADSTNATDLTGTEYLVDASSFVTSPATWVNAAVVVKAGSVDASGNAIAAQPAKNLIITLDKTEPKMVSTEVKDDKLIVKFDEPIVAGTSALTASGATDLAYKYIDKNGVVYSAASGSYSAITYGYDANNNGNTTDAGEDQYMVITLDDTAFVTGGKLNTGSYEVSLPAQAVKDSSNNESKAIKVTFNVTRTDEAVNSITVTPTQVSPGKLQFAFANTSDLTNDALNVAKYTINGSALPAGTNLYFSGNLKTVVAELPADYITVTGNRTLAVKDIVDKDGNTLSDAAKTGAVVSLTETVRPTATKVELVDTQNVKVTFSEALASSLPGTVTGVTVKVNGTKVALDTTTPFALDSAKKVMTIKALSTTAFNPSDVITVEFDNANLTDVATNKVKDVVLTK